MSVCVINDSKILQNVSRMICRRMVCCLEFLTCWCSLSRSSVAY